MPKPATLNITDINPKGHAGDDDYILPIINVIAHLWISCESLNALDENDEALNVHGVLERLCVKYNLPLAEAEAYANTPDDKSDAEV